MEKTWKMKSARALTYAGLGMVGVVTFVALLLGAAVTIAGTRWGGDQIAAMVMKAVNGKIAGHLEVKGLTLRAGTLTLEGVKLVTPDGLQAAALDRLQLTVAIVPLVRGHVRIEMLTLWKPVVDTSRVPRATAMRQPPTLPEAHDRADEPSRWRRITVESVRIVDGAVRDGRGTSVADLGLDASGTFEIPGRTGQVQLKGRAEVATASVNAPVEVTLHTAVLGAVAKVDARILVAGAPYNLLVNGNIDARTLTTFVLRAQDIDLADLNRSWPSSDLAVRIEGVADALRPDDLRGHVIVQIPEGRLGPSAFAGVTIKAKGHGQGRFDGEMHALLPGARIDVFARADNTAFHVKAKADVTALDRLASALGVGGDLSGRADLSGTVDGSPEKWAGELRIRGRGLRAGTNQVENLAIDATWPQGPALAGVAVTVVANPVRAGGKKLKRVMVTLTPTDAHTVALQAVVQGPPALSLRAQIQTKNPADLQIRGVTLTYPGTTWHSDGTIRVKHQTSGITVKGVSIVSGPQSIRGDFSKRGDMMAASLQVGDLDLAQIAALAGMPSLRGRLDLDVESRGTARNPTLALSLNARRLAVTRRELGDVQLSVTDSRRKPLELHLKWNPGGRPLSVDVQTPFHLSELLNHSGKDVVRRALTGRRPFAFRANLDKLPLQALSAVLPRSAALAGQLSFSADLAGPLLSPEGKIVLKALDLRIANRPPVQMDLEVNSVDRKLDTKVVVQRKGIDLLRLVMKATLPEPAQAYAWQALERLPVTLDLNVGPIHVQRLGLVPVDRKQAPRTLHGLVSAQVHAKGPLANPIVEATIHTRDLRLDDKQLGTVVAHATWKDTIASVTVDAASSHGTFKLSSRADAGARLGRLLQTPLRPTGWDWSGRVSANTFDLAWLSGLVDDVPTVGGRLTAHMDVKGPVAKLSARGDLRIQKGSAVVVGAGIFEDIECELAGTDRDVVLKNFSLRSTGGAATIKGRWRTEGLGGRFDLDADAKNFPIRSEGQVVGALSAEVKMNGSVDGKNVRLAPEIKSVNFQLSSNKRKDLQSTKAPEDIVLIKNGAPLNAYQNERLLALTQERSPAVTQATKTTTQIDVQVKAPRNLWVRADDLTMELGVGDGFRVSLTGKPRIVGTTFFRRGQIVVFGRRFNVDRDSSVTFVGPADNPRLDIKAQHKNESENVTVFVTVRGTPDKPQLKLTSSPPHSESAIMTLLLTGRLNLDAPSGSAQTGGDVAASVVGSLVAARLQKVLGKHLPLDVLTVEGGAQPGTARLEAGTYVTDRLYVAYVGKLGADPSRQQSRNSVHLDYQLTPVWSFEGSYGDARSGSADVVWKKRY